MQLKDSFFQILSQETTEDTTTYRLRLNALHAIYMAHFPGNPITPGVCMVQIIKELVSEQLSFPVKLTTIAKIRYFQVISPIATPEVNLSIQLTQETENEWKVSAVYSEGEKRFSQFSFCLVAE